jgi:hypothetical protein
MTKISIRNTSTMQLKTVARVALPQNIVLPAYPCIKVNNINLPLIPEKHVGTMTTIYSIPGVFPPSAVPTKHDIIQGTEQDHAGTFTFSPWTLKDPLATLFRIKIVTANNQVLDVTPINGKLNITSGNTKVLNFDIESPVIQGFKAKQILSAFSDLDHVQFKLALNWHDRYNPSYNTIVNKIIIESNDEFVIHHASQMGLPAPTYLAPIDTWQLTIVNTSTNFRDGQGFELRGYILLRPEQLQTSEEPDRNNNLLAVKSGLSQYGSVGEVEAVYTALNQTNNWFNKHLPNQSAVGTITPINPNQFYTASVFSQRQIGMSKTPGQTGAQEDFGADKGFLATVAHDPAFITIMKGVQSDRLRLFNIHEPNGSTVTKQNHPGRTTWNMETFDVTSQDTLGKTKNISRGEGTGWMGYDNQHRSQNNLLTYYALTGDELTLDTLENCLEADIAQAPYVQADREVGRMFNCWAKMLKVMPSSSTSKLIPHISAKITHFLSKWRGRFVTDPTKLKVNQVILDNRSAIVNPATGKTEPCWIPYQTAQAIQGIYSLSLEMNDPQLQTMLQDLSRTYLWYGVFKENNQWYPCLFLRYRTGLPSGQMIDHNQACPEEGVPLPPESYSLQSWEVGVNPTSWWWDWVSPAIAIAKRVLTDQPSINRAQEILDFAYPNGLSSSATAEWFATPL